MLPQREDELFVLADISGGRRFVVHGRERVSHLLEGIDEAFDPIGGGSARGDNRAGGFDGAGRLLGQIIEFVRIDAAGGGHKKQEWAEA
jgi:hypothetical protein